VRVQEVVQLLLRVFNKLVHVELPVLGVPPGDFGGAQRDDFTVLVVIVEMLLSAMFIVSECMHACQAVVLCACPIEYATWPHHFRLQQVQAMRAVDAVTVCVVALFAVSLLVVERYCAASSGPIVGGSRQFSFELPYQIRVGLLGQQCRLQQVHWGAGRQQLKLSGGGVWLGGVPEWARPARSACRPLTYLPLVRIYLSVPPRVPGCRPQ
jgi:hypothetical protein